MANLVLRRRLSEPTFALNIALNGVPPATPTESIIADIYWRFEADPTVDPQYLGSTAAGTDLVVPFDLKGQDIRLYAVSRTAEGDFSVRDIKEAEQTVYSPPPSGEFEPESVTAGESMTAPALVNLYNDAGTLKARYADASDPAKRADAYILDTVTSGDAVFVYFGGNKMTGLSGMTPGAVQFLSETAGARTETAPSAAGTIVQQVGVAISATSMIFEPQPTVELE